MASKPWSRNELILAMNLYCRLANAIIEMGR